MNKSAVVVGVATQSEQVNVSLDVVWQGYAGKFDARLSEISMEGCFIDSLGQETLGETINFKVHLPSGIWVSLQGEVVYKEYPIGFEVRFSNLTPENKRLLLEVIAAHGGKHALEILKSEAIRNIMGETAQRRSNRVLIADDDPMTLEVLRAIIETQGYEVVSAADGREAFRILQFDSDFNFAIFDMKMPHLDGLDLIQYMKTDTRLERIPIAMITAEQDPKIWDDSVAAGAKVFLPKPFTPPQIKMMLAILANRTKSFA